MKQKIKKLLKNLDSLRSDLLGWFHRISGRKEYEYPVWWVMVLLCLLKPIEIIYLLAARAYRPDANYFVVFGVKINPMLVEMMKRGMKENEWIRFVNVKDGWVLIEYRDDGYTVPHPLCPCQLPGQHEDDISRISTHT